MGRRAHSVQRVTKVWAATKHQPGIQVSNVRETGTERAARLEVTAMTLPDEAWTQISLREPIAPTRTVALPPCGQKLPKACVRKSRRRVNVIMTPASVQAVPPPPCDSERGLVKKLQAEAKEAGFASLTEYLNMARLHNELGADRVASPGHARERGVGAERPDPSSSTRGVV
jgi:hypothetical protein